MAHLKINMTLNELNYHKKIVAIFLNTQTLLAIVGLIGNCLTFCVFNRKRLKNTSYSYYYRVISILDSLVLLSSFRHWARYFYSFSLEKWSIFFCKFNDYQPFVAGFSSQWLMTVILIDRIFTIVYANRWSIIKRKWFQTTLIVNVIICGLVIYSSMPLNYRFDVNSNQLGKKCYLTSGTMKLNTLIAFANTFLNSGINMLLNIKLILFIYETRKKVLTRTNKRLIKDLKFCISSIGLTVINFLAKLPFGVSISLASSLHLNKFEFECVVIMATTIVTVSHAAPFFANFLLNSIFYEEFMQMIRPALKCHHHHQSKARETFV